MPLAIKTVILHTVDAYELERFIKEQYPSARSYSFMADQECGDDSSHRFEVKKELLHTYDQKKVDAFTSGQWVSFVTTALLTDLCNRDLLPEGTYLVEVG